jgi:outer membrane protein assembly factor BamB
MQLQDGLDDPYAPPAITRGILYVGTTATSPESNNVTFPTLQALGADNGQQLWKNDEMMSGSDAPYSFDGPVAEGELVYFSQSGGSGSDVTAYQAGTSHGTVAWQVHFPYQETLVILGISSSGVFVETPTSIQALSATDGHRQWQQPLANLKEIATHEPVTLPVPLRG